MRLGNKCGSLENEVSIYDAVIHDYRKIPTTNSYLVCHYGQGCVYPVDSGQRVTVNNNEGSNKILDKYYAAADAKIRATPNGQQIGGNRIFKKGAIIKVVDPSKEPEKVDGSDESWIKVYYDGNNVGYVALGLLYELPKPITGHTFKYKWEKSQHVTQDFKDKTAGVAKSLGIDPDDLMAVMAFESFGCNPAQGNMAGGSAVGLVQFMPDVAEELNTTSAELITMSGVEQLDYVFGYFIGRLYSVTIYEDDGLYAEIKVDGFQTLLRLKAKVEGNNDVIQFRFIDYYEEKDFNSITFSDGDILMKLENQKGDLITSWDKLQPITTENEKQGVYFEKAIKHLCSLPPVSNQGAVGHTWFAPLAP